MKNNSEIAGMLTEGWIKIGVKKRYYWEKILCKGDS